MKNLINSLQELSFNFAKYHYDEYLEKHKVSVINNVGEVVKKMFDETKEKELKTYIRSALKKACGSNYSAYSVETALSEMFEDRDLVINRIITEIEIFQKK